MVDLVTFLLKSGLCFVGPVLYSFLLLESNDMASRDTAKKEVRVSGYRTLHSRVESVRSLGKNKVSREGASGASLKEL
jgi:hypothetical protein